jgi:hypothetical protein
MDKSAAEVEFSIFITVNEIPPLFGGATRFIHDL